MILHDLTFEHLLPFRERQTVPLHHQGLVLVRGVNRISQAADSNGTGKSSIFSVLSFAWFGVSLPTPLAPSGRRGDDIACRFTKAPGIVTVTMDDDRGPWSVRRQARPKNLSVTGFDLAGDEDDKVIQEKIEARLGFGPRTFRNAIVFGQGAFERFAQADQADQMRMLDEIHGMDLRRALEQAKGWRDQLAAQVRAVSAQIETDTSGGAREREIVASLERDQASFDADRTQRLGVLAQRRSAIVRHARENDTNLAIFAHRAQTLDTLRGVWTQIEQAVERRNGCVDAETECETVVRASQEKATTIRDALRALTHEKQCPTCRLDLRSPAVRKKINEAFLPDLAAAEQETATAMRALTKARNARTRAVDAEESLWRDHPDIEQTIRRLAAETSETARHAIQRDVDRCRMDMTRVDEEVATERGRAWSGQTALDRARHTVADLDARIQSGQTQLARLRRSVRVAEYWVEAFGDRGIRSLLLDESAQTINDRLAHHLGFLAAGEAVTELAATRALKGGGTRERITVSSRWAWGGDGLGSGSCGQDRRGDLAMFAALQDLAELRSARPFPLKIFDEPLDSLDSRGKELGAQWIKNEARERGTVFLVTHSEEVESLVEPDAVWTVVLDTAGARIERS